jgi:hypothetical protein
MPKSSDLPSLMALQHLIRDRYADVAVQDQASDCSLTSPGSGERAGAPRRAVLASRG